MKKEFKEIVLLGVFGAAISLVSMSAFAQQDDKSQDARRAAFGACADEVGLQKPEPGTRPQAPSEEQRAKMDACLKAKGFQAPTRFGGGRPPGPPPQDGNNSGGNGGIE